MRYAAALEETAGRPLPPLHKWNPEFRGDIDLVIKSDGTWVYEGSPIRRARLVRLFSTVLKREGDNYYLVTPVEKLGLQVEDAPFVAVLMRREGEGAAQSLFFKTNVGDEVVVGPEHPLQLVTDPETGEQKPYIEVREGLEALVTRALFYDLVALGETHHVDGEAQFGVWSGGRFFSFGPAAAILNE